MPISHQKKTHLLLQPYTKPQARTNPYRLSIARSWDSFRTTTNLSGKNSPDSRPNKSLLSILSSLTHSIPITLMLRIDTGEATRWTSPMWNAKSTMRHQIMKIATSISSNIHQIREKRYSLMIESVGASPKSMILCMNEWFFSFLFSFLLLNC